MKMNVLIWASLLEWNYSLSSIFIVPIMMSILFHTHVLTSLWKENFCILSDLFGCQIMHDNETFVWSYREEKEDTFSLDRQERKSLTLLWIPPENSWSKTSSKQHCKNIYLIKLLPISHQQNHSVVYIPEPWRKYSVDKFTILNLFYFYIYVYLWK